MSKEELLANLKLAVAAKHSSRSAIGAFYGLTLRKAKDAIDYLMKKNRLKNADIGIVKP